VKLYMNVGQLEGFNFNTMKEFLSNTAGIRPDDVTWTDVKNTFSLVEVRSEAVEAVLAKVNGVTLKGRTIRIESRGNKDAGVPRTRFRSDTGGSGGGGYKGKGGGGGGNYGGGSGDRRGPSDRKSSSDRKPAPDRSSAPAAEKKGSAGKKESAPKYDWNQMFADKPMRGEGKKKKK